MIACAAPKLAAHAAPGAGAAPLDGWHPRLPGDPPVGRGWQGGALWANAASGLDHAGASAGPTLQSATDGAVPTTNANKHKHRWSPALR